MGSLCSCCESKQEETLKDDGQYASLVVTKPPPITLAEIQNVNEEKMDVPLFATVESDDDEPPAVSDPETLTDTELNLYAKKLTDSEDDDSSKKETKKEAKKENKKESKRKPKSP
ncbi:hypothetical protein TRFO_37589 [Tritrichomonas foetus]|uniref:Uncharacterized protein n=1 Tax=Tritrichomonas foetus TaxID=1144522 RepID=A0A1J4JAQ0_9EUKA|nr:hypothetical protein TRFO_37589 [Tritrichomonas foetus]|eukprot:OHS96258.1 hypothetical protein TRFO_37589 [Tritrichomonas foetus]